MKERDWNSIWKYYNNSSLKEEKSKKIELEMTSGEYFENKWFDMNEPVTVYWFNSMKSDSGTLSHFVFIATVCNVYSLNR